MTLEQKGIGILMLDGRLFRGFFLFLFFVNFAGYSKGWDVCSQLGQSEGYQALATRQELMAFALTHCPPGNIEPLLAASSALQTEVSAPDRVKLS